MESATYVGWKDSYSVGIPVIDEQHKELIRLTDNLYAACLEGNDAAGACFKDVIHSTVDYIKYHFSAEERIMSNANYPDFAAHKKQHESFVKKVIEDAKRFEEGKAVPYSFVNYLKEWILNHIALSDKDYSQHILGLKKDGALKVKPGEE